MICVKFCWNPEKVLDKKFLKISSTYFPYFVSISPYKDGVSSFEKKTNNQKTPKNSNHIHLYMLCVKFVWNLLNYSWEEDENVKSLETVGKTNRRSDGQMDGRRKTGDQKSLFELSAQVS